MTKIIFPYRLGFYKVGVKKCFLAVEQRAAFIFRPLLSAIKKDVLPSLLLSIVIYNFLCHCDSRYVGHSSQQIQDKIRQHVPNFIRSCRILKFHNNFTCFGKSSTPVMFSESTIGQRLSDNLICAKNYSDKEFTLLLYLGRSSFHLFALEAVYINHASQIYAAKISLLRT